MKRVHEEEDRTPVGRLDFKSGEGRTTSLVGSTPTLFRHIPCNVDNWPVCPGQVDRLVSPHDCEAMCISKT